jgi:hypothetical protein
MFRRFMFQPLMHAAGADGAAAGGGSPTPTPTPSPSPTPAPTPSPTPTPTPTPSSVLATGANANMEWLSDKYHVKTADGKLDEAASIRKQAEAYSPLAKRMVDIGLPPESADKYELKAPEKFDQAIFDNFAQDKSTKDFMTAAHAKGFTQGQMDFVMNHFLTNVVPQIGEGGAALDTEAATAQLKEVWKSDQEMQQNAGAAYRAANTIAQAVGLKYEDVEAAGLGNNPVFLRIMAAIGKEMGEDTSPNNAGDNSATQGFEERSVELRKQLEALPIHDPKRKAVQTELDGLYNKRYGTHRVNVSQFKAATAKK